MEINSIANTAAAPAQSNSSIGQEDLFKILLAQLQYQDPLEPIDNQEFIAQLAQFTDLEQSRALNDKVDQLMLTQTVNQSVTMLGKTIQVRLESITEVGQVTAVAFSDGTPKLTIQTADNRVISEVSLAQIQIVN
ncbi:MAG: flagellar hook capping FlgD N-terminal domain-containing protein [Cycloclasticus sp.]|jgi:Flagellar hook capping protein